MWRWNQWMRRTWLRRMLATTGGGALLGALCLGAWRYGLTPLPAPVTPPRPPPTPPMAWERASPDSPWHWIDRAAQWLAARGRNANEDWLQIVARWIEQNTLTPGDAAELRRVLGELAELDAFLERAVAATNRAPPETFPAEAAKSIRVLAALPLARAALAAAGPPTDRFPLDALEHLAAGFRLQARLTPASNFAGAFDERGPAEMDATLGRAFRRLALAEGTLDPAAGRALLAALGTVTNHMTSFAEAYGERLRRVQDARAAYRQPNWRQVRRSTLTAVTLVGAEMRALGRSALRWIGIGAGVRAWPAELVGLRHFGPPIEAGCRSTQRWVARDRDFDRLWEAAVGRLVQAAERRAPAPPTTNPWAPGGHRHRAGWLRGFDRPAVWASTELIPLPIELLDELGYWLASIEACRLTLALRLYRDEFGEWPEELSALCPEILSTLPPDPFGAGPFRYERRGDGWRLAVGREDGTGPRLEWFGGA